MELNTFYKDQSKWANSNRASRHAQYEFQAFRAWQEHCYCRGFILDRQSNDMEATAAACCVPDSVGRNGIHYELQMWDGWKSGGWPSHLKYLHVFDSKIHMRTNPEWKDGYYVLINTDETHAVVIPFSVEPVDSRFVTTIENGEEVETEVWMIPASQCHPIELLKVRTELN